MAAASRSGFAMAGKAAGRVRLESAHLGFPLLAGEALMPSAWKTVRKDANEWGLAVLLLLVGAVLLIVSHAWPLWGLLEPFSHALLIAGFLAVTVEAAIRRRFATAVAKDVSGALIGYRLPRELQDDIKRSVTTVAVVMADYRQHYVLAEIPGDDQHVSVAITTEYDVRNYSADEESYRPRIAEEESYKPRYLSLTIDDDVVLSGPDLEERIVADDAPAVPVGRGKNHIDGPEVRIPGREGDDAPHSVRVRWRLLLTMGVNDTSLIAFGRHTIGVQVTVEKPAEFAFWVSPVAGRIDGVNDWRYPCLFRDGEHLRVRWWRQLRSPG
jgi:hypothetical protein